MEQKNKYQTQLNYFLVNNNHNLYLNKVDKNGKTFKTLECPVLKDKQFYSYVWQGLLIDMFVAYPVGKFVIYLHPKIKKSLF